MNTTFIHTRFRHGLLLVLPLLVHLIVLRLERMTELQFPIVTHVLKEKPLLVHSIVTRTLESIDAFSIYSYT